MLVAKSRGSWMGIALPALLGVCLVAADLYCAVVVLSVPVGDGVGTALLCRCWLVWFSFMVMVVVVLLVFVPPRWLADSRMVYRKTRWDLSYLFRGLTWHARASSPPRIPPPVFSALPQIARVGKMLADEYGTATNIKSRVNKLSVLSAITSTQQRLK